MIRLGPFELESIVGHGGMAEVWMARHVETGTPVAVKVLTSARTRDPMFVRAFRDEVRAVAGLDHPHIVTVHDHGLVPSAAADASRGGLMTGSPYLVMELASGGTLASPPGPASYAELRSMLTTLLAALAHAHARGLVHRDIKPANVLRCADTDVRPGLKLADFGIARAHEPDEERDRLGVAGTLTYMSPEQAAGRWRDQGPWSDLYSLGCVAFRLASGRIPYAARNVFELVAMQMETPRPTFEPRFAVPEGFDDWIATMLSPDPADRFGRAADAAFALVCLGEKIAVSSPTIAPPDIHDPGTTPLTELATLTWSSSGLGDALMRVRAMEGSAGRHPSAPMPESWRSPEDSAAPTSDLSGAGLGLFGVRTIPFVDRDAERDRLWAALARVRDRGPRPILVLEGATGCGKSRLAQWLCERAHETGAATPLVATHSPAGDAASGLAPMLARHLRAVGLPRAGVIERVDLGLTALGGSTGEERFALAEVLAPSLGPGGTRAADAIRLGSARERHEVITRYLELLGRQRPVIVWLDDVQWSIDGYGFLLHVLERHAASPIPLLVVATVRDEALAEHEATRELHAELTNRSDVERIRVEPLAGEHWPALVRGLLGLEGDLALQVEERAAGNPQFAVQLVGDWVERGILRPGGRGFRIAAGARAELPVGLREVWDARVEQVLDGRPDSDATALELAAVLGQDVDAAEWRAACDRAGVAPAYGIVETLLDRRLAAAHERGPEQGWKLVHALLRESLERRAARLGRLRLHHLVCAEALGAAEPVSSERFGRHLLAAGESERAVAPLLRAAERRVQQGDFRQALALLQDRERALDSLEAPDHDVRRSEGWVVRALAASHLGRLDDAAHWARAAEQEARANGHRRELSTALFVLARVEARRGLRDEARLRCEESERAAAECGFGEGVARALLWQGVMAFDAGDLDSALGAEQRALDAYAAIGDEVGIATATYELGITLRARGDREQARSKILRALELSRALGVRDNVGNALNSLGEFAREDGHLDAAERYYRSALEVHESVGSVNALVTRLNLGLVLLGREQWGSARATFEETRGLLVRTGWRGMLAAACSGLLAAHAGLGNWPGLEEAFAAYQQAQDAGSVVDPDLAATLVKAYELAARGGAAKRARPIADAARAMWLELGRADAAAAVERLVAAAP